MAPFRHDLYPFTGTFRNVNGFQLHALDEGEGDTVIMLHGNHVGQEENIWLVVFAVAFFALSLGAVIRGRTSWRRWARPPAGALRRPIPGAIGARRI